MSDFQATSSAKEHATMETVNPPSVQNKLSDFSLELKPKPKMTCIPGKSQRNFYSETTIQTREVKSFEPDKSWSVLFFSAKDKEMNSNL